jgi:HlyD family secretion protein
MNWRRILIIAFVVIIIAVGGFFVFQQFGPQEEETEDTQANDPNTTTVDTGVDVVGAEGTLVPLRHVQLSVPLSGQVAELFVAEGDEVAEGDPLLRLDTADQEVALQQAQAGLTQAEANSESAQAGLAVAESAKAMAELGVKSAETQLALVEAGPTAEQIAVSELGVSAAEAGITAAAGNQALVVESAPSAQILAAEARLRAAQAAEKQVRDSLDDANGSDKERLEEQLVAAVANVNAAQAALDEVRQGATQAQRLSAGSAVVQSSAQRDAAQAQLDLLLAGAREEQLEVARVGVQQAEAALGEAELAAALAETAVAQAEAGVQQASATVNAAQKALDLMTLEAPFGGTVADLAIELGEVASPGFPVVTIADFDGWLVETTDLKEFDVVALAVDFPVDLVLDAFPGEDLRGTVTDIDAIGRFEDQFKQSGDILYKITILLDDPGDLALRWGMTADVTIDTDQ